MTTIKTYSNRSNAKRAAKDIFGSDAREGEDFGIYANEDGRFYLQAVEPIPAEPAEDKTRVGEAIVAVIRDMRAAESKAPATPRAGSKVGALIERAMSPSGLTYGDIRATTGWTRFGGFFTAAKRAGLVLHQCRERIGGERDTRFFAVPADDIKAGRIFAYFEGPDGRWVPVGDFADQEEAVRFAQAEAPEGTKIEARSGRHGEVYLVPAVEAQAEAAA